MDGESQRPAVPKVAPDAVPRPRALAERHVRELEQAPRADPDRLVQAFQVLKTARLERWDASGRRWIVGKPQTGREWMTRQDAIRATLRELQRRGITVDRAPQEAGSRPVLCDQRLAVDLVVDANLPVDDHAALHPRGQRGRR